MPLMDQVCYFDTSPTDYHSELTTYRIQSIPTSLALSSVLRFSMSARPIPAGSDYGRFM